MWLTVRFPLAPGGALTPERAWEVTEVEEGGVRRPWYEKHVSFLLWNQRLSYTSRLRRSTGGC